MYTDASGRTGFSSVLDVPLEARRVHGSFWSSEEMQQIICIKELQAVKLGLIEHTTTLQGHTVLLYQDNMAVVGCLETWQLRLRICWWSFAQCSRCWTSFKSVFRSSTSTAS